MSRIERPSLAAVAGKLEAAAQLLEISFSDRGEPVVPGKTADDVFLQFGRVPLDLPRSELAILVEFLKSELDGNTLSVTSLDLGSQLSPYDLRGRLGSVCAALHRRCAQELGDINLTKPLTPDSIAEIRAKADAGAIDPEVFAMAAAKSYLTLIRTGELEAADTLAGAFLPERSPIVSFDIGSIEPQQLDVAYKIAARRAISELGERDSEKAAPLLGALRERGRLELEPLRARLHDLLTQRLHFGEELPEHVERLIAEHLSRAEIDSIMRETIEHAIQMIPSEYAFGFDRKIDDVIDEWKKIEVRAVTTQTYDAFRSAIRSAYLVQLAAEGPQGAAAGAIAAAFEILPPVTDPERRAASDAWCNRAVRNLFSNGLDVERLREIRPQVPAPAFERALLEGAYRMTYGMHPKPDAVAELKSAFPEIGWSKIDEHVPPVKYRDVDLRAATEQRLKSDDAKALGRLFFDWWGMGSLGISSGSKLHLSIDFRIRELQDAAKRALELQTGSVAGSPEAIADSLIAIMDRDLPAEVANEQEARRRQQADRLSARVQSACGGALHEVPYSALIELQSALSGVEREIALHEKKNEES
jgi:hypothetical protein